MKDCFLTLLKEQILLLYKRNDTLDKENYRPVSMSPFLSRIYERAISNQLREYMQNFLNRILCGFRRAHSFQHALFKLLQAWQRKLDISGNIGTILMDFSKAYNCMPHDLLIAKLEAYGLDKISLNILFDYLFG